MPSSQGIWTLESVRGHLYPGRQAVHVTALSKDHEPLAHAVGAWSVRAQAVPARQLWQLLAFVVLQDPCGQGSGCVKFARGHLDPAGHRVHMIEAANAEYDPIGHNSGAESLRGQADPGGH